MKSNCSNSSCSNSKAHVLLGLPLSSLSSVLSPIPPSLHIRPGPSCHSLNSHTGSLLGSVWSPLSEPLKAWPLTALSPELVFSQRHHGRKEWVRKSSVHPSLFLHLLRSVMTPALCLSSFLALGEESTDQDNKVVSAYIFKVGTIYTKKEYRNIQDSFRS